MAFVGKSALASGSVTVTPTYGSATAGNLLVALVSAQLSAAANMTLSGSTTGWTARQQVGNVNTQVEIWDKIAVGSDTMPTWNSISGSTVVCQIAEFSSTTTYDQGGTNTSLISPLTVTASGTDATVADLVVSVVQERSASAGTETFTHNVNSLGVGTGINVLGDNSGSTQTSHHHSIYVTTATTGSSADNDVITWSVTSAHAAACIVSYSSGTTTTNIVGAIAGNGAVAGSNSEAVVLAGPVAASGAVSGNAINSLFISASIAASGSIGGPPSRVQAFGNTTASGTTVAATATVTQGNFLVAVGLYANGGSASIADSKSNVWTQLGTSLVNATAAWYAPITTGGSDTVTMTAPSATLALSVIEITGQSGLDVFAQAGTFSAAPNSGPSPTPSSLGDLALGLIASVNSGLAGPTAQTFSPALRTQTNEPSQVLSGVVTAISDGPTASQAAETYSATLNVGASWQAWIAQIAPRAPSLTGAVALSAAISANGALTGAVGTVPIQGSIAASGAVQGTVTNATPRLTGSIAANGAVTLGGPRRVQGFGAAAPASTVVTAAATVTVGSLLIAVFGSLAPATISDLLANTWVQGPASGGVLDLWYTVVTTGGADLISITTGFAADLALSVIEITGQAASPFDATAIASGGTTSFTSGATGTPANYQDLGVGAVVSADAGPPLTRGFSPALVSEIDEATQTGGVMSAQISDGLMDGGVAETYLGTFATAQDSNAWCLLIAGAPSGNFESVALSATIAANGALIGNLLPGNAPLAGTISATGSVQGVNLGVVPISGAISAAGTLTGTLGTGLPLAGTISANGLLAAIPGAPVFIKGAIAGNGAVSGKALPTLALAAVIAANGTVSGINANFSPTLVAAIAALGSIVGSMRAAVVLPPEPTYADFPITSCTGDLELSSASGILALNSASGALNPSIEVT